MKRRNLGLAAVSAVLLVSGCGQTPITDSSPSTGRPPQNQIAQGNSVQATKGQGAPGKSQPTSHSTQPVPNAPAWPTVRVQQQGRLPLGLLGNAAAVGPNGSVFSVGGYTGVYSVENIFQIFDGAKVPGRTAGGVIQTARLPVPTHDAAAGFLGHDLYVFGGGQSNSYDTIVRITGSQVSTIGHLPHPLSDAQCVPFTYRGQRGLALVGGYDGQGFNQTVQFVTVTQGRLVWTPLFTLPAGVRYPGVAASGSTLFIAGGKYASGALSSAVYSWSEQHPIVHLIGKLPSAIEKAAVFAIPGYVLVAGGFNPSRNAQTSVLAINTTTGAQRVVGQLPQPLADLGYAQSQNEGFLVGGVKSSKDTATSTVIYSVLFS